MSPLKVIEQRCPDPPLWDPLLKILPEKTVAQFMFMREVLCERGTRIFLYKHIWSRRYINLDQHGQAYQFHASEQGSHYVPAFGRHASRLILLDQPQVSAMQMM